MLVRQDAPLIGRAIGLLLRPLVALYGWWFGFRLWTGTVYVVAPDNIAVMVLFLGGLYIIPWAVFTFWQTTLVALAVAPLVCLSALRIANGQVVRIRLLLCIPYWFTPVPNRSYFDLEQSWDDPAPTGVAFGEGDDAISFGSSRSAHALYSAVSDVLQEQRLGPQPTPPAERKEPTF